ncbi:MAG: hypothetical protein SOT68_04100 [Oscillospiraceae bacterium]|nr:hypothetical protein [Oscillospiraceae bacterium]MDY2863362.1 hypothetical protein [Oscillospiraceae bacterium]
MAENGFLKTVNFGGFDKKDVLAYVDQLNTKIYTLENELEEKKALLENSGGNMEDKEKYEKLLESDKAKITELQTSNESLKNQLSNAEAEAAEKDKEIAELKKKVGDMENELIEAKNAAAAASPAESSAMDLTNVFMEAQRTATTIVTTAKENARKMDEDAKKLANQVVDDANSKASTIVKTADEKAAKILTDAEDKSSKMMSDAEGKTTEMRRAADNMKAVVLAEIGEIEGQVNSIKEMLDMISKQSLSDSIAKINETAGLLTKTQDTLKKDGIPEFTPPKGVKMAAAPAPAVKPAPTPAPAAAKPAPAPAPAVKPAAAPTPAAANPAPAPAPAAAAKPEAPKPAAAPTPAPAKPAAAPKPTPKLNNNFGFDLSEIEAMAKAIEADASKHNKGTPLNDGYDGNVDPKSIKLSNMG